MPAKRHSPRGEAEAMKYDARLYLAMAALMMHELARHNRQELERIARENKVVLKPEESDDRSRHGDKLTLAQPVKKSEAHS